MDKIWQYRNFIPPLSEWDSGGYPNEPIGVIGGDTSWKTTSSSFIDVPDVKYYFRDSNNYPTTSPYTQNSSRVVITVDQTISVNIDNLNVMHVTVNGIITSIVRDDVQGNPGGSSGTGREIYLSSYKGATPFWSATGLNISTNQTIGTNITIPEWSFTLEPGEDMARYTLYVLNCLPGYKDATLPNINVDAFPCGMQIRNTLPEPPKDYRPGMTWNGISFMSHNRSNGGICNYWNGSAWTEMRTQDYPTGKGNPPLLYRDGDWYNQALIGNEQNS